MGAAPSKPLDRFAGWAIGLAEREWLPDFLVREGVRRVARERLEEQDVRQIDALVKELRQSPIAVHVEVANQQHYELPPEFFRHVLGNRLKYSACHWAEETADLDDAEGAMLRLTCERANIEDGMRILDLGCGWGSFALWVGEHFPRCRIVAASNSAPQGRFITHACAERGLTNVEVRTADVNVLEPGGRFDRVVSIEMFEHMRNYELLLRRIAGWLRPGGMLFVHAFCHRRFAYLYDVAGESDWMARWFFTGGTMPSLALLEQFQDDLELDQRWFLDGSHYARTAEAWLANLDQHRAEIVRIFQEVYGPENARLWLGRWRLFFLACAEVFAYQGGQEWGIGHYRFTKD